MAYDLDTCIRMLMGARRRSNLRCAARRARYFGASISTASAPGFPPEVAITFGGAAEAAPAIAVNAMSAAERVVCFIMFSPARYDKSETAR